MNFSLVFSRKTWYLLLVISAALSMSASLFALIGQDMTSLNVAAFAIMGLTVLFLAAEKSNDTKLRGSYFKSFLLAMLGYVFGSALGLIGAGLAWPMLLYTEQKRGAAVMQQLRMLIFAEAMYAAFWMLASGGNENVYLFVNLFALLKSVARGWAALVLYRDEKSKVE